MKLTIPMVLLLTPFTTLAFAEPTVGGVATSPTWPAHCADPAHDQDYLLRVRYPTIRRKGSVVTIGFRAYQLRCLKLQDTLVAHAFSHDARFELLWEVMMPWSSSPTREVRVKVEPIKGLWADVELDLDYNQLLNHFGGADQGNLWLLVSTPYGSNYSGQAKLSGLHSLACPSLNL